MKLGGSVPYGDHMPIDGGEYRFVSIPGGKVVASVGGSGGRGCATGASEPGGMGNGFLSEGTPRFAEISGRDGDDGES
jgi:hypothetical protein